MLRRVIAENPSKFTYRGTGTYIVGEGEVAVVDPGPMLDSHRDALAAALAGERVTAICVTHCHSDHSPLAAWLREETGRADVRLRPAPAARSRRRGGARGGDRRRREDRGDDRLRLRARRARRRRRGRGGRAGLDDHAACTRPATRRTTCASPSPSRRVLFPGDHVMGWSTTVVSPPDGDMAAYIDSLRKVAGRPATARTGRRTGRRSTQPQRYVDGARRAPPRARAPGARRRRGRAWPRSRPSSPCSTPTSTRSCTSRPAARCWPTSSSSSTRAPSASPTAAAPASPAASKRPEPVLNRESRPRCWPRNPRSTRNPRVGRSRRANAAMSSRSDGSISSVVSGLTRHTR